MPDPRAPQDRAQGKPVLLRQASAWLDLPAEEWHESVSAHLDFLRQAVQAADEAGGLTGAARMAEVLQALGRLKRHLISRKALLAYVPRSGLARLSSEWFDVANDGSWEFELAAAVAAMVDADLGPLRPPDPLWVHPPLAPAAEPSNHRQVATERGLAHAWTRALLARLEEGAKQRLGRLPLASMRWASFSAVCGFLSGQTDDQRIEELFLGLAEAERPPQPSGPQPASPSHVLPPRAYALLKLCLLPEPVGGGAWPANPCLSRSQMVAALGQGDLFRACWLAAKELQAVGIAAEARASAEGAQDPGWRDAAVDPLRLAAALLVPIGPSESERLVSCV